MSQPSNSGPSGHPLSINLLGGFQLTWEDEPVAAFSNTRLQRLLTYLILHRATPHSRQVLAQIFWPDSNDSQARTNLRNALHLLRNNLPNVEAYLTIDNKSVQWKTIVPAQIDLLVFDASFQAGAGATDGAAAQNAYATAIAQYKGDLLPDCLEEWILPIREEWQQRYYQALQHLAERLEQQRKYAEAIEIAQKMLQIDPLQERHYGLLMSLQAADGDRAAALRTYHNCQTQLIDELGVEPGPAIQAIYERLLDLDPEEVTPESTPHSGSQGTPLIGRDDAWAEMQQAWKRVGQGRAELLLVSGEAGIGKSRLAQEWSTVQTRQGTPSAAAHCYSAGGRLAFAPIQAWLRTPQIQRYFDDLPAHHQQEIIRLLPELGDGETSAEAMVSGVESMQRTRLFNAMSHLLAQVKGPLLLMLDDIQWCDQDTLEWIEHLFQYVPQSSGPNEHSVQLLLVATLRTGEIEADHPVQSLKLALGRKDQIKEIKLSRLDKAATGTLIQTLTGEAPGPVELEQIFADTEGNPLFVEEMVRSMAQAAAANDDVTFDEFASQTALPPKIQSIIEGRLVRLSPAARSLADVAAVVGRVFTTGLLITITEEDEDTLLQGLEELWQQQIIREFGQGVALDDDAYDFAHDKLRDVVYQTLSPIRRRQLHRRAAQALAKQSPQIAERASSQIASHFERGGQPLPAIQWHMKAAQTANQLSASYEALFHLDQALQLLDGLPDNADEATQLELAIQMERAPLLLATKGYAAPEAESALTRAWEICQHAEDVQQRFKVMWGLSRFYQAQPNFEKGMEIARQMVQLADETGIDSLQVEAYAALGTYHLHRGSFEDAITFLDQSLAIYDDDAHGQHAYIFGQDPKVVSLAYSAWTLFCLGRTKEAQSRSAEALAWSDVLAHPYSRVIAHSYAAVQQQFLDNPEGCLAIAESASALAKEHGFRLWIATSDFLRGWSLCRLADGDPSKIQQALEMMQGSAELYRETGAKLGACYFAGLLAETLAQVGQAEGSSFMIQLALMQFAETQERWCVAELHRIHSSILLQSGKIDEAQSAHEEALRVAEEQGATWWLERIHQHHALLET